LKIINQILNYKINNKKFNEILLEELIYKIIEKYKNITLKNLVIEKLIDTKNRFYIAGDNGMAGSLISRSLIKKKY